MRNAIALVCWGVAHVLLWILGIGTSIFELLWLIGLAGAGQWGTAFIVLMIGTPILLTIAYWISMVVAAPFLFAAIKLNPEFGE